MHSSHLYDRVQETVQIYVHPAVYCGFELYKYTVDVDDPWLDPAYGKILQDHSLDPDKTFKEVQGAIPDEGGLSENRTIVTHVPEVCHKDFNTSTGAGHTGSFLTATDIATWMTGEPGADLGIGNNMPVLTASTVNSYGSVTHAVLTNYVKFCADRAKLLTATSNESYPLKLYGTGRGWALLYTEETP